MEKNKEIKWDFDKDDKIYFFDPNKSYFLTKYRPITMTEGLDFNPEPFQEVYRYKVEHGVHCEYTPGTKGFKDFWLQEIDKCINGVTINGYTITGDHYFFLNYYRLLNVNSVDKAAGGRSDTAPSFWAKHYEYFHYLEICKRAGFDCCVLKSRGVNCSII